VGIAITGQIFFSTLSGGLGGGAAPHAAFVHSLEAALVNEVLAFLAVAGLVLLLKAPAGHVKGRPPQPVEV
jgi:hypothetical protein